MSEDKTQASFSVQAENFESSDINFSNEAYIMHC